MLILKPSKAEKKLVLGDYVTVHVSGIKEGQGPRDVSHDIQEQYQEFFQRIEKERKELNGKLERRAA